jgi:CheY-like chemotaxis protein
MAENYIRTERHSRKGGILAKGKILVMDDEDLVRTVAGKMLEFLGYEVVLAGNGEEAVSLYASHRDSGKPFDAAILDWLVPEGMDGFRTMEHLRRLDPEAKGILSSGFSEQDQDATKTAAGFTAVIGKPYELRTLRETIESVLSKSGTPG